MSNALPPYSGFTLPGGGGGGGVTSVSVDAGELTDTGTPAAPVLGLATTGVAAASYAYASLTVDTFGRLTAASSGAAPVTGVSVDAGELTNTGTATAPVLGLATAGTAGTYTSARVTTDVFGRVSAASNGARTAAGDPTVLDDSVAGYFAGYTWANTVTSTVFYCVSAAVGAAVWVALGASVVFSTTGYFGIDTTGAQSAWGAFATQTGAVV